jgi:hypothetical protein
MASPPILHLIVPSPPLSSPLLLPLTGAPSRSPTASPPSHPATSSSCLHVASLSNAARTLPFCSIAASTPPCGTSTALNPRLCPASSVCMACPCCHALFTGRAFGPSCGLTGRAFGPSCGQVGQTSRYRTRDLPGFTQCHPPTPFSAQCPLTAWHCVALQATGKLAPSDAKSTIDDTCATALPPPQPTSTQPKSAHLNQAHAASTLPNTASSLPASPPHMSAPPTYTPPQLIERVTLTSHPSDAPPPPTPPHNAPPPRENADERAELDGYFLRDLWLLVHIGIEV